MGRVTGIFDDIRLLQRRLIPHLPRTGGLGTFSVFYRKHLGERGAWGMQGLMRWVDCDIPLPWIGLWGSRWVGGRLGAVRYGVDGLGGDHAHNLH